MTDGLGSVTEMEEIEYNDAGLPLQDTAWSSEEKTDDALISRKFYSYNEAGSLLTLEESTDGEKIYIFYEYNDSGKNTITTVVRYREEELVDKTVTVITYDSRLNPVEETVYLNGGRVETAYSCEYDYYDDGKIRTKTNFAV